MELGGAWVPGRHDRDRPRAKSGRGRAGDHPPPITVSVGGGHPRSVTARSSLLTTSVLPCLPARRVAFFCSETRCFSFQNVWEMQRGPRIKSNLGERWFPTTDKQCISDPSEVQTAG